MVLRWRVRAMIPVTDIDRSQLGWQASDNNRWPLVGVAGLVVAVGVVAIKSIADEWFECSRRVMELMRECCVVSRAPKCDMRYSVVDLGCKCVLCRSCDSGESDGCDSVIV